MGALLDRVRAAEVTLARVRADYHAYEARWLADPNAGDLTVLHQHREAVEAAEEQLLAAQAKLWESREERLYYATMVYGVELRATGQFVASSPSMALSHADRWCKSVLSTLYGRTRIGSARVKIEGEDGHAFEYTCQLVVDAHAVKVYN